MLLSSYIGGRTRCPQAPAPIFPRTLLRRINSAATSRVGTCAYLHSIQLTRMPVQIFGTRKNAATRKAERFFAERRIPVHFVDLMERAAALGELKRFAQKFGVEQLVDRESRRFAELGLRTALYGEERWLTILSDEPLVLRQPLVRGREERLRRHRVDPDAPRRLFGRCTPRHRLDGGLAGAVGHHPGRAALGGHRGHEHDHFAVGHDTAQPSSTLGRVSKPCDKPFGSSRVARNDRKVNVFPV